MYKFSYTFLIYTLILITNCNAQSNELLTLNNYSLFWSDEFNSNTLNKEKWDYRYLGKRKKGINTKKNVSFHKSNYLKLDVTKSNNTIYTAMIGSQNKFETKYGYFEAKIKLQNKIGSQSAFWLQSSNFGKVLGDLEKSGAEIDIYEYIKKTPKKIYHTIYYDGYKKNKKRVTYNQHNNINDGKWHTFGLLWDKNSYKFYIDKKLIWSTNKGVSRHKQYIVLSVEATKWSGKIISKKFHDFILVDYVRVYKKRGHK